MKNKNTALTISPEEPTGTSHLKLLGQAPMDQLGEKNPIRFWNGVLSFFRKRNDLTFEDWQRLEKKAQRIPDPYSQPFARRGL